MTKQIYLDYAAATPLDPRVIEAMEPYFTDKFYNPSATYMTARQVRQDLNKARAVVAMWLGARPFEIFFTAGATEANNLAIAGVMRQFPEGEVLVSAIEHDSVLAPASLFKGQIIPVSSDGIIDIKALEKLISPKTVLISVMMVNNELGTIQPIKQIAALVKEVRQKRQETDSRRPLYLHTDAAQAGNLFDLHTHRLGVDLVSINGGKIYGPKQTGVLFVKTGVAIEPMIVGGGQEGGLRSGTENVGGAVGLSKALDLAQKNHAKEFKRLNELRSLFVGQLAEKIPAAVVNGSPKSQSPHLVHVTLPGHDNERMMIELDEAGVQVAVGSACSASNLEPSHVLTAIGLSDEMARSSLRFSLGRATTTDDIKYTVEQLAKFTGANR
jgi:cysteine desulfurase